MYFTVKQHDIHTIKDIQEKKIIYNFFGFN
jgi:hypothetical protein